MPSMSFFFVALIIRVLSLRLLLGVILATYSWKLLLKIPLVVRSNLEYAGRALNSG